MKNNNNHNVNSRTCAVTQVRLQIFGIAVSVTKTDALAAGGGDDLAVNGNQLGLTGNIGKLVAHNFVTVHSNGVAVLSVADELGCVSAEACGKHAVVR